MRKIAIAGAAIIMSCILVVSVSAGGHNRGKLGWLYNRESRDALPRPKPTMPAYAFRAAGGTAAKVSWAVLLFGRDGQNCWGTQVRRARFPKTEGAVGEEAFTACGLPTPPSYWGRIAGGPIGTRDDRSTVMFFTTRLSVGRLRVTTSSGDGHGGRLRQSQLVPKRVSRRQAHRARLHRNFGYAVLVTHGLSCVREVAAFDREGKLLKETPVQHCQR